VFSGGGRRVWLADRSHLHFRLLDAGLSVRQAVSLLYAITIVFGLSTLWVTGKTKVFVLIGLTVCSIGLISWAVYKLRQRDKIRASTI
jgi:UDP-GlcNAc:undecaprenyl-phosphate GlcNAc-1-phosphate transferase